MSGARCREKHMNIKDIVKDNHVTFLRYRQGVLYYCVSVPGVLHEHMFPVPVADVGDATLGARPRGPPDD